MVANRVITVVVGEPFSSISHERYAQCTIYNLCSAHQSIGLLSDSCFVLYVFECAPVVNGGEFEIFILLPVPI